MSHSRTANRVLALLSLLALLTFALSAFGQQGSQASVAGVVRDPSGAVIPGAKLTLKNTGTNQTLTTTSAEDGTYLFSLVNSGTYTVTAEKDGFLAALYREVQVVPGQQYSLTVSMQVGAKAETVEVIAGQDLVNTTTSEIAGVVDQNQILKLPLLGRNPIELIRTQAGTPGILDATRNTTTINGARPGWTQTSQDGININDQFIRTNSNDFVVTRPTADNVAEFSVVTNNVGADNVGGSSQVKMVTPAGTNSFHGEVYEYNRNSALSAAKFFDKRDGLPKNQLNQNQFGVKGGAPILKNKLFFFGNYEGYRLRTQASNTSVVPIDNNYLSGTYQMQKADKSIVPVNVLDLINSYYATHLNGAGLSPLAINPEIQNTVLSKVKKAELANSTRCGDGINTTCTAFQQTEPENRDQESFRFDYNATQRHSFQFVMQRYTDYNARTDIDYINPQTKGSLSVNNKLFVGAWRWMPTSNLVNEVRMGDNTSTVPFLPGEPNPAYTLTTTTNTNQNTILSGLLLTPADYYFLPQGRSVTTRQFFDNGTWTTGKHTVAFGVSYNHYAPHSYNYASTVPNVTLGFAAGTPNAAYGLLKDDVDAYLATHGGGTANQSVVTAMNRYAAFLSGTMSSASQTFQAKDIDSGFVSGFPQTRKYEYSIWSPYVQDSWRVKSNLTLIAGLKWEYWTPLRELNNLGILPVVNGSAKVALLNPSGSVAPVHGYMYQPDKMQFAPNFGFAWDPFKDGKTSIRGGYSYVFANENLVTSVDNALNGNPGLSASMTMTSLTSQLTGAPQVTVPTFNPNRTYAEQLATFGVTTAAYGIQNDLRTPYVHEINLEIQREVKFNTAVYVRYVGTLGRDMWRGVDHNQQMSATNPGYMADFKRARHNYFACGGDPYGFDCASAQELQWFPTFDPDYWGALNDPSFINYIWTGQAGELANQYVTLPQYFPNARPTFLPNRNIYVADELKNGAVSSYHALQLEARRALKNGLGFQVNYTWSKLLSDSAGTGQFLFEPFMDNARPHLDYGRSEYDLNHVINANFMYELPFGRGKKFLGDASGALEKFVGGWSMSSIIRWQSGNPFSFLSGLGTYNRASRSSKMPAYITASKADIQKLIGVHEDKASGNIYWIDPSVLAPDGSAVWDITETYDPTFEGQMFYNPQPGEVGNMQRLQFNGPSAFNWDFSAAKTTRITERVKTEFRADFFNVLNRTNFGVWGDYNINNDGFGKITDALPNRIIQMSFRLSF